MGLIATICSTSFLANGPTINWVFLLRCLARMVLIVFLSELINLSGTLSSDSAYALIKPDLILLVTRAIGPDSGRMTNTSACA